MGSIGKGRKNLSVPVAEAELAEIDDLAKQSRDADGQPMDRAKYVRALIQLAKEGRLKITTRLETEWERVPAAAEDPAGYASTGLKSPPEAGHRVRPTPQGRSTRRQKNAG